MVVHTPPESEKILSKIYPNFPEINFVDFLEMVDKYTKRNILVTNKILSNTNVGFQTVQFVALYSTNPESDLKELIEGKTESILKLPKINFLPQEFLREDLLNFLVKLLGDQSIEGIISSEVNENVSRLKQEKDWRQFWTSDFIELYSEKEQLLLNAFPEYKN